MAHINMQQAARARILLHGNHIISDRRSDVSNVPICARKALTAVCRNRLQDGDAARGRCCRRPAQGALAQRPLCRPRVRGSARRRRCRRPLHRRADSDAGQHNLHAAGACLVRIQHRLLSAVACTCHRVIMKDYAQVSHVVMHICAGHARPDPPQGGHRAAGRRAEGQSGAYMGNSSA